MMKMVRIMVAQVTIGNSTANCLDNLYVRLPALNICDSKSPLYYGRLYDQSTVKYFITSGKLETMNR